MRYVSTAARASSAPQRPPGHAARHRELQLRRKKICKSCMQHEKRFPKLVCASAEQLSTRSRGQPTTGEGMAHHCSGCFQLLFQETAREAEPLIPEKLLSTKSAPSLGLLRRAAHSPTQRKTGI